MCHYKMMKPATLNLTIFILLIFVANVANAVTSINVEALFSKKLAVVVIDGVRRTISVGKASPEGVKLISTTSKIAKLEVDGVIKEYELGTSIAYSYTQPEMFQEKIYADERGMFIVTGSINGLAVTLLIDTGATSIAMNTTQAKRLGIHYRLHGRPTTASTASGFVKAYEVKLKTVTLGSIKQKNVTAMVIDGQHPGPILLGMTFLSKLKVSTAGNVMTIKARK